MNLYLVIKHKILLETLCFIIPIIIGLSYFVKSLNIIIFYLEFELKFLEIILCFAIKQTQIKAFNFVM